MFYRFCPRCGHSLQQQDENGKKRPTCTQCGFVHYLNPAPAVGVILEQEGSILLVQRKFKPKAGDWSLPAGFVEYDETPLETAVRETKEETGLDIEIRSLFEVYGACDDPRVRVVLIVYTGMIVGGKLTAGDDAIAAQFFPMHSLPVNMAFSSHHAALKKYVQEQISGNTSAVSS
ncbi:NUDIX hydrolase [candidate division KSB1 bacterium]|nr:NUDIX hydrolase [candidate division KSB1 bacterium]